MERTTPPTERCAPVIITLDETWHRPMTALELAALQGFGPDLVLSSSRETAMREDIGNAVPPPSAHPRAS